LLLVAGKNVILVVCDRLSEIAYFIAITKRISVEGFAAKLTKVLNSMLGIETML